MTMPNPVAEVVERLRKRAEAHRLTCNYGPAKEFDEQADLIERQQAEIERLSRERDTADEHFVVINGPDGACVEVVSGRDRLVETCRNILWSGEGDVPEDVLAILDTVGNPDADEWTEHGAPARLRFDFEDGALEILRVNFMPRAVSRERDTGVPEGQTAHEESEARLLGALQRNLALRVAMQRAAKIIKTNLYHQREKVADAETILLEALENSEPDAAAPQPPTVSLEKHDE